VVLAGGADIIDAKEPASGALGRVEAAALRAILRGVDGRLPVSATIGDVALEPALVTAEVEAMAASGVDIVKIGLFPGALDATLRALGPIAARGVRLVAVIFADRDPDLALLVPRCADAGFFGAMLDTADKSSGPLTAHCGAAALAGFVALTQRLGLVSGLAGSLRRDDIPALARLGADYLGFRSALTSGDRQGDLDPAAVRDVRRAIDASAQVSSRATATAGAMSEAIAASSGAAPITSSKAR
jgi:uncharacterized protein (UPF0264 family)